ncbi:hypothetical protein LINPERHAP2_LOCUS5007 [Linum perenne]
MLHDPCKTHISCVGMKGKPSKLSTNTINGFAFHPSLPMAVSSSGHRRFQVPDDEDDNFPLTDDENYVSVWSFSCGSTIETGDIDETLAA